MSRGTTIRAYLSPYIYSPDVVARLVSHERTHRVVATTMIDRRPSTPDRRGERRRCGGAFVGTIGIVFGLASMVVGVNAISTSTSTSTSPVESTPRLNDHSGERDVVEKKSRRHLTFDDLPPAASPTKIYPSTERPLGRSRKVDFEVETSRPDPNFPDSSFDASIDRPSTSDLSTTDSSTSTTHHRRRLATLDESTPDESTLDESTLDESTPDDSGGSEGGAPPLHCEVFAHADGLGVRGSSRVFGGLMGFRVVNATFPSVAATVALFVR